VRSNFACEKCSFRLFYLPSSDKIFDSAAGGGVGWVVLIMYDWLVRVFNFLIFIFLNATMKYQEGP
jgi:hypothetical protein